MDSWSYFFKKSIAQLVVFVVFLTFAIVVLAVGFVFGIAVALQ